MRYRIETLIKLNYKAVMMIDQDIPLDAWTDWHWQIEHQVTDVSRIRSGAELTSAVDSRFPCAVTPFYLRLAQQHDPDHPLWKQILPAAAENDTTTALTLDPLAEERDSPVRGLVHRYPNRVLLLLTNRCALYCRHCNRRRRAMSSRTDATPPEVDGWLTYLTGKPEVQEAILSGGDPLLWSDARLADLWSRLRRLPSLKIIRIGSRLPVVLPYRFTDKLIALLAAHAPLYLNIHINHPDEISPEFEAVCHRLSEAGIPLGSQTVLLRDVNDDVDLLAELFSRLLELRVKPYSLYHPDPVQGTAHFRLSLQRGLDLMQELIPRLSGLALPHYVLDAPDGRGKIPLLPQSIVEHRDGTVELRDFQGGRICYPDGT